MEISMSNILNLWALVIKNEYNLIVGLITFLDFQFDESEFLMCLTYCLKIASKNKSMLGECSDRVSC